MGKGETSEGEGRQRKSGPVRRNEKYQLKEIGTERQLLELEMEKEASCISWGDQSDPQGLLCRLLSMS